MPPGVPPLTFSNSSVFSSGFNLVSMLYLLVAVGLDQWAAPLIEKPKCQIALQIAVTAVTAKSRPASESGEGGKHTSGLAQHP